MALAAAARGLGAGVPLAWCIGHSAPMPNVSLLWLSGQSMAHGPGEIHFGSSMLTAVALDGSIGHVSSQMHATAMAAAAATGALVLPPSPSMMSERGSEAGVHAGGGVQLALACSSKAGGSGRGCSWDSLYEGYSLLLLLLTVVLDVLLAITLLSQGSPSVPLIVPLLMLGTVARPLAVMALVLLVRNRWAKVCAGYLCTLLADNQGLMGEDWGHPTLAYVRMICHGFPRRHALHLWHGHQRLLPAGLPGDARAERCAAGWRHVGGCATAVQGPAAARGSGVPGELQVCAAHTSGSAAGNCPGLQAEPWRCGVGCCGAGHGDG